MAASVRLDIKGKSIIHIIVAGKSNFAERKNGPLSKKGIPSLYKKRIPKYFPA